MICEVVCVLYCSYRYVFMICEVVCVLYCSYRYVLVLCDVVCGISSEKDLCQGPPKIIFQIYTTLFHNLSTFSRMYFTMNNVQVVA